MIFYFDRNIGTSIPGALRLLGLDVRWHNEEEFGPETEDETWLAYVGTKGWIVITQDTRIERRENEIRALVDNNVGCFVLRSSNNKKWDKVRHLASTWDKILAIIETEPRPFIYRVNPDRSFRKIYPK